jgi:hypothetical protein
MANEKLKRHKLPGGRTICSKIHKLINSIWNKKGLPEEQKGLVIAPIYKKGDNRDCSYYRDISFVSTTYKLLSNIFLSKLISCAEEIIGDQQCGL